MEFRWRGNGAGTKTNLADGRNWVDGSGTAYSETRYPGSATGVNDDVLFDAALASGASSPAGYDASSKVKLRSIKVSSAYDGTIASAGTWWSVEAGEVIIDAENSGDIYIEGVNTDGLENLSVLSATGLYLDGRTEIVNIQDGTVSYEDSSTIATSLTIGANSASTADVTLGASMTLPSTVYLNGGAVDSSTGITTLQVTSGTWTQTLGNITTLRMNGSAATLYWNDGNITTAYLTAGSLDATNSIQPRRIQDVYLYTNGTFNYNDGAGSVLITGRIYHFGGTLTPPVNAQLEPYSTRTETGASYAVYGIAPQSITSTSANGTGVYLSENDKLEVFCQSGDIAAGGGVTFQVYQDDDNTFASEVTVPGKAVAWNDSEDNLVYKITVWGYELGATTPWVRVKATEGGGSAALVSAHYVKYEQ